MSTVTMKENLLHEEFEFYVAHQGELTKKFKGRWLAIKGKAVLGDFASQMEAITETAKSHSLGTFLVQKCEAGKDNYTQSFHSRVAFA